uniref:Uncharacterized protein n=1 Tax=uncultured marine virus TaxID=186617 RepID=A0A0F7L494_9VIRU|nr:hypothetical protein [uncultured marine virus]
MAKLYGYCFSSSISVRVKPFTNFSQMVDRLSFVINSWFGFCVIVFFDLVICIVPKLY